MVHLALGGDWDDSGSMGEDDGDNNVDLLMDSFISLSKSDSTVLPVRLKAGESSCCCGDTGTLFFPEPMSCSGLSLVRSSAPFSGVAVTARCFLLVDDLVE